MWIDSLQSRTEGVTKPSWSKETRTCVVVFPRRRGGRRKGHDLGLSVDFEFENHPAGFSASSMCRSIIHWNSADTRLTKANRKRCLSRNSPKQCFMPKRSVFSSRSDFSVVRIFHRITFNVRLSFDYFQFWQFICTTPISAFIFQSESTSQQKANSENPFNFIYGTHSCCTV